MAATGSLVTDEIGISQSRIGASELYINDVVVDLDRKVTGDELGENTLTKTTTGLNTVATNIKDAINETVSSKALIAEASIIDCSQGSIIEMPLTSGATGASAIGFSNLEAGGARIIELTGDYEIEFDSSYNEHFQSPITMRNGDIRLFTVFNYGTGSETSSALYGIKDALQEVQEIEVPLTPYGSDATIGIKTAKHFTSNHYLLSMRLVCNTAPSGAPIIVDCKKNGSTSITSDNIQIDAGDTSSVTSASQSVFTSEALREFTDGDNLEFEITQVGSGTTGQGVTIITIGYSKG